MKVFVFTYDRFTTITTSMLLEKDGIAHKVLCHSGVAAQHYAEHGRVVADRLVVTDVPKGLAYQRNAALDMMDVGEWAVFLVDDYIQGYEYENYDTDPNITLDHLDTTAINKSFNKEISIGLLIHRGINNIPLAESIGANLIGYALHENPFFLKEKYKTYCLADGRAWIVRKTDLRFDERVQLIDDTCWTAINLQSFGRVLVDNWVIPRCLRYSPGAYGTIQDRLEQKKAEARYLVEMYGDVVKYASKPGWPYGSHVQIKTNRKSFKVTEAILKKVYGTPSRRITA